jgi:DNA repair photolyase
MSIPTGPIKGRGAVSNRDSRFSATSRVPVEDGEGVFGSSPATTVTAETPRAIISRNRSPDIPFDQSINSYRGCEHGCIYCYARPTHAYLGLSPGLDFETRLVFKRDAGSLLRRELSRQGYVCKPIALGANTDPYQPIERRYGSTREILQVLHDCHHPVTLTTKSALIERDLDLLVPMAERGLVGVQLSLTTLDKNLARILEPRAASPARRLETLARLAEAGIPTGVLLAPVIPFINDAEIEAILAEAARFGARNAGYVVLRLPREIADLFREWLQAHFPLRAQRVMHCMHEIHGGRVYDPRFGVRQCGSGTFAQLLQQRFRLAQRRHGLQQTLPPLDTKQFSRPRPMSEQLELF